MAAVVAALVPAPVHGQERAGARLALTAMPAWVAIGSPLAIDVRIEDAAPDAEVVVTVRGRLESRSAFVRTLDGRLPGRAGSVALPVAELPAGTAGTHLVTINVGEPPPPPDPPPPSPGGEPPTPAPTPPAPPALPVSQEGVYPLVVELRDPGEEDPLDRLVTYLVALDEDENSDRTPLSVAWVWPLAVDAPLRPDGTPTTGLREAVSSSGRLGQMAGALQAAPDVPVTLAPRPTTVDAWEDLAAEAPGEAATNLEALRSQAALDTRQVLTGTYARVDLLALAREGLDGEITAQLAEGADALRSVLGIRPDPRTFLAGDAVDEDTLGVLRKAGVDRLVVDRDVLVPVFEQLTPARPFEIESEGRPFLSASSDDVLGGLVAGGGGRSDAEVAQRLLAGLTLVALEAPSEERGVVVVPPSAWAPSTDMLAGALDGLSGHPALDAVILDDLFARVDPAEDEAASRVLGPRRPGRLRLSPAAVERARSRIDSLATMLPPGAAEPATAERRLLLAQAEPFQRRGADPSASDYLAGVDGIIASVLGAVRLPETPSVTLTAQRGRVPITLVNDSGAPLRVRVAFSSDKLLFPDGDRHDVVLPPRSTTEQFAIEARTSGTFPMLVVVSSPDGRLEVGRFEMTVRSTAVSGVALTITVGAGLFLVGWWGNHIRKARRARREDGGG